MKVYSLVFLLLLNFWLFSNVLGESKVEDTLSLQPAKQRLELDREIKKLEWQLPKARELYNVGYLSKKELDALEEKYASLMQTQQRLADEPESQAHETADMAADDDASAETLERAAFRSGTKNSKKKSSARGKANNSASRARALRDSLRAKLAAERRSSRHSVARSSSYRTRTVALKSSGSLIADSSLSELKSHYYATFHEELPISAHGQSATHNSLGWDHSGRVDVALHPDSDKGQLVINFLRARNIAFIGFRAALPGQSTGPHIHIGPPSSRIN